MKLTTVTHVTLDGVMQGLGGADEDRAGGFERGGWAIPLFDEECEESLGERFTRADAFLFGRRTYEIFERSWGTGSWGAGDGDNPISAALNMQPKYVVSTTMAAPQWSNTTVLGHPAVDAVRELKAGAEGDLQVHGSGALTRWLHTHGLVDEVVLYTYPLVVGQGTRLFPDSGTDVAFQLIDFHAMPSGVTLHTYRPQGRPQYAVAP